MSKRRKRGFPLLALTALLVIVLALLVAGVRGASYQDKTFAPYVQFFRPDAPDCPTLCWHGIRVGVTTIEEAQKILSADPSLTKVARPNGTLVTWESIKAPLFYGVASGPSGSEQNGIITMVSFEPVDNFIKPFILSDALAVWGVPVGQETTKCSGADSFHGEIRLFFKSSLRLTVGRLGLFSYINATDSPDIHLSPESQVGVIRFYSALDLFIPISDHPAYSGFRRWLPSDKRVGYTDMCGM